MGPLSARTERAMPVGSTDPVRSPVEPTPYEEPPPPPPHPEMRRDVAIKPARNT